MEALDSCLKRYDRRDFGVMMRQVEVALFAYDNVELAIRVLRHFVAMQPIGKPNMQSWVIEALPMRVANTLERHGYPKLASADAASDEDLTAIPMIGETQLQLIRKTIRMVKAGVFVPDRSEDSDLAPEWDFIENFRAMVPDFEPVACNCKGSENVATTELAQALAMLIDRKDEAIAEIDKKIGDLQKQLTELKGMRKMLGAGPANKPKASKLNDDAIEPMIEKLLLQHGPMSCADIGAALDMHHVTIGHVVRRSKKLRTDGKLVKRA